MTKIEIAVFNEDGREDTLTVREFLQILEPEIKKIAKKAATEVIRDQNDCG